MGAIYDAICATKEIQESINPSEYRIFLKGNYATVAKKNKNKWNVIKDFKDKYEAQNYLYGLGIDDVSQVQVVNEAKERKPIDMEATTKKLAARQRADSLIKKEYKKSKEKKLKESTTPNDKQEDFNKLKEMQSLLDSCSELISASVYSDIKKSLDSAKDYLKNDCYKDTQLKEENNQPEYGNKNKDWKQPGKYFKTLGFTKDTICKWKILDVSSDGKVFYVPANENAEMITIEVGEPLGYEEVKDSDVLNEAYNEDSFNRFGGDADDFKSDVEEIYTLLDALYNKMGTYKAQGIIERFQNELTKIFKQSERYFSEGKLLEGRFENTVDVVLYGDSGYELDRIIADESTISDALRTALKTWSLAPGDVIKIEATEHENNF